ncbi:DMT family transporter [Rhodovulum sp. BSW8]|uniref:DMT family transporter n=1 Tax=Rhodovulum visakhapatnamense TaxID=364297 RepID=A0A4R8FR75_9RHOB|nr:MULTISPECIES: DMT family transporter [Rhodovulum]OLS42990.1 EamA family transporter [Rhodovulum sulfidophilum]MBL3570137.1 DMT family transporter [Rhodovulum visakhapatnamense]MBL3576934.1 DMT family transporter [Rhodovulum visakhapatnamense]RBO53642.1 DMT family transporter [Rhodovulum sp. BSW8]TDX28840.1 threonine/homoserine efflux transporter RhtA [Rhodovulum visakhapatnamense]
MDIRALAMGLAFAFIWASAFSSGRIIVGAAPPLTALCLRFLVSGLIGVGIALALGQSWRLTRPQWQGTLVFGLSQNALYLGLNYVAMQTLEASMAAIVASSMPLLVALFGWIALGQRLRPLGALGLAVGFAGVAVIMGSRISGGVDPLGLGLTLAGVLALTVATLAVRTASSGGNLLMIVGLQMLVGAAALALAAVLTGERWEIDWTWPLIFAFSYTVVFPSLVATWIWFLLVRRVGAVRAATFHFLSPFFGVGIAAFLLGERLGPADIAGVAIVMAGILAVQLSKQGPAAAPAKGRDGS